MKLGYHALVCSLLLTVASAFQPIPRSAESIAARSNTPSRLAPLAVGTPMMGTMDIQEMAQRDVYSMQTWAQNCGVQMVEGLQLVCSQDGVDWSVMTNQDIPMGSPVLYVPAQMILCSSAVEEEFGGNLEAAENALVEYDGTTERIPLFRLIVKILAEYEEGSQSPYFPWLNSLPRRFYNGVAMTDACFECLPAYAAWLSKKERDNYSKFLNALQKGYLPLSEQTLKDENLIKWAYNVALTRHNEVFAIRKEKKIAPMADMFNHATYPNVAITYDSEGNCVVTTTDNVPGGSPLCISLGDPTNPTPLFAKYGFLYDDCTTIFCKAIHLQNEIEALGYKFNELLLHTATGNISPKVWDIFLYKLLQNDPNVDGFFHACQIDDEATKQAYHAQYFPYTLEAIKEHVSNVLRDADSFNAKASTYDLRLHPRVPMIMAHNNLVKSTFLKVLAQLETMG